MANAGDQELGLRHVEVGPFTFHAGLPFIELGGDTLFSGVSNAYQVISMEKLPRHTSAELTRGRLQHQDEEQWAKDRALIVYNPTPNSSLY